MRAALQLALEHQSLEATGLLEEEPFRRGQRTEILATTIAPLKSLETGRLEHLLTRLAVVYGIEPMVILGHLRRERSGDPGGGALDDGCSGRCRFTRT